jgi:hypothetical protein
VNFGGKTLKIPYIVTGCGGHGGQVVSDQLGVVDAETKYDFAYKGWGYTKAEIIKDSLTITSYSVEGQTAKQIDNVTVPLT